MNQPIRCRPYVRMQFATPSVARDRYEKTLHEADVERASGHYARTSVAGAGLGLALRKPGMSRKTAALRGAAAGLGTQAVVRTGTSLTRDRFGDRSPTGKLLDKVPALAIGGAALVAGHRRLSDRIGRTTAAARRIVQWSARWQSGTVEFEKPFAGYNERRHARTGGLNDRYRKQYNREHGSNLKRPVTTAPGKLKPGSKAAKRRASFCARMGGMPGATSKGGKLTPKGAALKRWNCSALGERVEFGRWRHGAALAGGIAVADGVTSGLVPEGKTRAEAVKHGLLKGGIYGTALAVAEPALMAGLKRLRPRKVALAARVRTVQFGGKQQILDSDNRFLDPLKAASGERQGYIRDDRGVLQPHDTSWRHGQVLTAAYNKGGAIYRGASRAGGLLRDAPAALRGEKSADGRKNEWHKAWVKRAAGAAVMGAGLLAHTRAMRRNPGYRQRVVTTTARVKSRINRYIPDAFPEFRSLGRTVQFAREDENRHPVAAGLVTAGALAGVGLATHRGLKAIGSLQRRGAAAIRRVHSTAGDTMRETIKTNLNPAIKEVQRAAENTKNATSIYADAGKVWNGAKEGALRLTNPAKLAAETRAAYRAGRSADGSPDSLPVRIGRAAGRAVGGVRRALPSLVGMQWQAGSSARPIHFDMTAPEWDVRDQRGRSARVFAPGARPRERREKAWHERVDNIRKLAVAGAVAAAGAGIAGGHYLGRRAERARAIGDLQRLRTRFKKPGGSWEPPTVVPFPRQA